MSSTRRVKVKSTSKRKLPDGSPAGYQAVTADMKAHVLFHQGYTKILAGLGELGYEIKIDPNFDGTDRRAAEAFSEIVWSKERIDNAVKELLATKFPLQGKDVTGHSRIRRSRNKFHVGDMVILNDKVVFSLCPHHLLPVVGKVNLAYIPQGVNGQVLGISKLARLVDVVAKQPMLQESLVGEIANHLFYDIGSGGSAVTCSAIHLCMACRGVKAHETSITVTALRGAFDVHAATRREFYDALSAPRINLFGASRG